MTDKYLWFVFSLDCLVCASTWGLRPIRCPVIVRCFMGVNKSNQHVWDWLQGNKAVTRIAVTRSKKNARRAL